MPKRVLVTARGGPEVLQVVEEPLPEPGGGEVRVRMLAAGVAFGDVFRRLLPGKRPYTPGYDVVGRIDALGSGARGAVGDYVAVFMPETGKGGYAQYVCVPDDLPVPVPEAVPPVEAVALGLNFITAYQLIERFAPPPPGGAILVHGAAGGVGTALLQLARRRELRVLGTVSCPKHPLVSKLGAIPIDYRSEDFVARVRELCPEGVDVVYDPIGGKHLARSRRTLRRGGTVVALGASEAVRRGPAALAAAMLRAGLTKLRPGSRRIRIYNITLSPGAKPEDCRRDWQEILRRYVAGEIQPVIGKVLPLEDAAEAHRLLERAAVAGKIVLVGERK